MSTYISILRGINVGKHKRIKMEDLKNMYKNLSFENIYSYIQSGNVIFSSANTSEKELEIIISEKILATFGYDVPTIVLKKSTLENIIKNNPFADSKEESLLHVTFLAEKSASFNKDLFLDKITGQEEIAFTDHAIYLYCPNSYSSTKISNDFIEKQLNVKATTRNWKTTKELLNLASK